MEKRPARETLPPSDPPSSLSHGMTWYGMVLDGMRKLTNSEAGVMAQGQHTVTQGKESEQKWWRMNP